MSKKKLLLIIVCGISLALMIGGCIGIGFYVKDKKEQKERAQYLKDYFDSRIAQFETENTALADIDIAFLGDSLTDGCDLKKYYPDYKTVNRGIGGDTAAGLKTRLKQSAYDVSPKIIVLLIGCNDILSGRDLVSLYADYQEIIQAIQTNLPDTKIIWCSLTALGGDWTVNNDKVIVCNQTIKMLAAKYNCTFVDLFTPLCNVDTGEIFGEYTVEGVHFTDSGYVVVSGEITKAIEASLTHE